MKHVAFLVVLLAAGPAFADLALEVELENAEIEFEAKLTYVVRFVNRGTEEVSYFEPLHVGLDTFPDVRLVKKGDGRELRPYDSPYQSMVSDGLQGTIIRLKPGEKKEYRHVRDRFLAVDRLTQKADWYEPRPLPDGEYELRVAYARADRNLPFNTGGFDVENREVKGIFTGEITAPVVKFQVMPPTRPHIRITMPDRKKTQIIVVFSNPSKSEHVFAGDARFVLGSKAYGSASARCGDGKFSFTVPPGGRVDRPFDLRSLNWVPSRGAGGSPLGLGEFVPSGLCHLRFEIPGATPGKSDGIWVPIPKPPTEGMDGVTVTATLEETTIRPGDPLELTVSVENLGEGDVALVHRLSFPKELVVRIEDATGERPSIVSTTGKASGLPGGLRPRGEGLCRIAQGLSWDRDAFEPVEGLTRKDFVWIEPKAGIEREFDLRKLLAKGPTPGRYRVYAGYRNSESGARLGFPVGRRAATGVVWSKPVELTVTAEDE